MRQNLDARSISRFQKLQYLKSLSEDDFRDLVIRPLFFRLGFEDGRDLCGPTEFGKDVIFTEKDTLGLIHVVAVQTKVGNLNLARKASNNLIESITQLRTALSTTIPLPSNRVKCTPAKVFLCASGIINDAAKRHVVDEVKDPRIHFLDADDLIPRIDDAFPELWFGIDAEILPYFRAIKDLVQTRSGLSDNSAAIDILSGAASNDGYVTLNLYRTTTKIRKVHGQVVAEPEFEEFPATALPAKRYPASLILAEAGMGKSTILLRIAFMIADRGITSRSDYTVPIILRAIDIFENIDTPLQQIADTTARSLASAHKAVFTASDLASGRVLMLVDALDEVPRRESRARVLESVEAFRLLYPKCKVIVTARPYRDLINLPGYDTFNVGPISWNQAAKILRAAAKGKRLPTEQSREILRRLEQIHGLELNPLLVSVFAATSEYSRQDIPANITELFKKFTELMLGRWDEQKGLALQYQAPLKDFLLRQVAFYMHEQKLTGIPRKVFEDLFERELRVRGHETERETLVEEVLFRSGLFRVAEDHVQSDTIFYRSFLRVWAFRRLISLSALWSMSGGSVRLCSTLVRTQATCAI